jgi:hypothetical protein
VEAVTITATLQEGNTIHGCMNEWVRLDMTGPRGSNRSEKKGSPTQRNATVRYRISLQRNYSPVSKTKVVHCTPKSFIH